MAIGSAPGASEAGLVRLSGPEAGRIGRRIAEPADRVAIDPVLPTVRGATRSTLLPPLPPLAVLALWMPGPRTFTGEDTLEIEAPGHPALLQRIVREAEGQGARPAEAGEFSHRAFEAGRISLLEAEGTAAAIAAENDAQLAAAETLRGGRLAAEATAQRDALVRLLALVEAGIDFTDEEDVVAISPADLAAGLGRVDAALASLLAAPTPAAGALPRVVLAGPPSAGKSTLFNALLGRERALTDAAEHTTRDALEEELPLPDDARVLLVDTPGGTLDPEADLTLWLGAGDPGVPHHAVAPRTGREPGTAAAVLAVLAAAATTARPARTRTPALLTRHREALARSRATLAEAADAPLHELAADALTRGVHALGGLTGELEPDDLIASVFTTFCVGK